MGQPLAINPASADNHLALLHWGSQLIIKAHGPREPFQDQYNKSSLFYLNISSPSQGPLPACALYEDVITRPGL